MNENKVIEALKEVYDPEIPINVYDLGLIYKIEVENKSVRILMTFTSPTCPTGEYIMSMVEEAVSSVEGVEDVDVEVTFDPPWSPEMVSSAAKEELGIMEGEESEMVSSGFEGGGSDTGKICFNCSATEYQIPLLDGSYNGERIFLCTRCMNKF